MLICLFAITALTASAQKFALLDMEYILKNIPAYERANEPAQPTHKPQETHDEQPKKPKKPSFISRFIKQMSDGVEKTFEDAEDEQ